MDKINILLQKIQSIASELDLDIKLNNIYNEKGEIENYGIIIAHDSPPKGYPDTKTEYADPKNYKYPVNSTERVRAAWSYIHIPKNQKGYSPSEVAGIKSRIRKAAEKFGVKLSED